jgi:type IV secretion system protein VirB4
MASLSENLVKFMTAKNDKKIILAKTPHEDFIPYAIHYDKKTLLTKNGELMQIIKVVGFNNTSVFADLISLREAVRDAVRDHIKQTNFALWFTTIRRKKNISPDGVFVDYFSNKINQAWEEKNNLRDDFVNELYISILIEGIDTSITNVKNLLQSFSKFSVRKTHNKFLEKTSKNLSDVANGILASISDYGAKFLEITEFEGVVYSEPMRFLGKLCNLEDHHFPLTLNDISTDLFYNKIAIGNKEIQVVTDEKSYFSGILSLKEYIEISTESLDKILQLPFEFIISQSFDFSYSEQDLEFAKYQDNILRVSGSSDFRDICGLTNFFESVNGTNTDFGKLQTTFNIISNSSEELNNDIKLISEKFQEIGLVVIREDLFLENCYWSQLPGNFKFLKRQKVINSYQVAGFGSLYSFDSGSITNTFWGPALTTFKTINHNPYFFNFHDGDNGHAVFIGSKSSGKTVLINFLLAQARRYNSKIFYFDYKNKAQNFIEMLNGFYYDIACDDPQNKRFLKINPLAINNFENYKKFLNDFFNSMIFHAKSTIPENEIASIEKIIEKIITNKIYNFKEAIEQFNNAETANIYSIIKIWNNPQYSKIFDNPKEINLNDRLMGFDLSFYQNSPQILLPIFSYILFRIENSLLDNSPSIMVFKNAKMFFDNPIFFDNIIHFLDRLRQKNCLAIFSFDVDNKQNNDNKLLKLLSQKTASMFVMPSEEITKELSEDLEITDEEFRIIKYLKPQDCKFLLKIGNDSLVLNFDLSDQNSLLRLLSSSQEDIAILDEIFNHAKQDGKIIDNEIAIKQFSEIIEILENERIAQEKQIIREQKIARMKLLREIKD